MLATLTNGMIFAGRYRLIRRIATGGMGTVYEAVHLETERRRAIKVMHPHLFQSDEMRERFKREARIAAQVESEHVVDVSDAGVDEATGVPFMVMELLRGEDLGARLKRLGRLPPGEVLVILEQAAAALDRTHQMAIVHRDLKPENLFLTQREDGSPRIKILDFGVAKIVAEGATAAGATESLGTPLYMAPEQFRLGTGLTPAADIFALGMLSYTLLVGEPYWRPEAGSAGNAVAFALAAAYGPKERASERAARAGVGLPPGYDGWFARVTATEPAARFTLASEAVHWLAQALDAAPVSGKAMVRSLPSLSQWGQRPDEAAPPSVPLSFPAMGPPSAALPAMTNLERMTTSTGGAFASIAPEGRRLPVIAMVIVGVGTALLVTGAWLLLRGAGSADNAAAPAQATALPAAAPQISAPTTALPTAAPPPSDMPALPEPTTSASTNAPAPPPPTSSARPPAAKTPPPGGRAAPTTTAKSPPLFGRD